MNFIDFNETEMFYDQDYKLFAKGELHKKSIEKIDLFLKDGAFYETKEIEKIEIIQDVFLVKEHYYVKKIVVCINFDFFLIEIKQSERDRYENLYGIINRLNKKLFIDTNIFGLYNKKTNVYSKDFFLLAFLGSKKYDVFIKNYKGIREFEHNLFLSNLMIFIGNNPDFEKEARIIYEYNLKQVCDFYMVTKDEIQERKFNKLTQSIKRLNFKINRK